MSAKVIIRGHIFDYADKSPFVASGQSTLGALEYEDSTDSVKCHECGVWIRGLGQHIKKHGLKRRDYNLRHGLRMKAGLSGIRTREKRSTLGRTDMNVLRANHKPRGRASKSVEFQNQESRCRAQLIYRLQVMAAQKGRTPTTREMEAEGLSPKVLRIRFGAVSSALYQAGLHANVGASTSPLPKGFPSKAELEQRLNERMPWPKDYFSVNVLERRRA